MFKFAEKPLSYMKIKIGIIFGGFSREREISFAGGRTVYDNLNKTLFEAIPVFVDSFGNFVLLDWQYIYKGSIRDFYPPVSSLPESPGSFQVYAESLGELSSAEQENLINKIGKKITVSELSRLIDFAFLCLHGPYGEDGRIQGVFEYAGIPYSGSGILSSAIGINKAVQKKLMKNSGFDGPDYITLKKSEWIDENKKSISSAIQKNIGFPCVIKPSHQGSSIGVSIVSSEKEIKKAVDQAFFIREISSDEWKSYNDSAKNSFVRSLADIREGLGMPVLVRFEGKTEKVYHPDLFFNKLNELFIGGLKSVTVEGCDGESEILIEQFIEGKEFSCIVIRNENEKPVALPPTEIRKGKELFDYRSKYLPGLSRKITPIELKSELINQIRKECERLFLELNFNVYARIDGFVTKDNRIFLNDPNTTSGMMPSSFFFHQAAEIGLNPSQFLTYIIRTSLLERINDMSDRTHLPELLERLDGDILSLKNNSGNNIKVAVILGGYSTERHISVESGRNVYEKLSSSDTYSPIPVFLTGSDDKHRMFQIPVPLMLKDNADDIKEKIEHYSVHAVIKEIMHQCEGITKKYTSSRDVLEPKEISYDNLHDMADVVFIALHGRPGEDGEVQRQLEKAGIPYNGSGVSSSKITINKYETNEILRSNGFKVASHRIVTMDDWKNNKEKVIDEIKRNFSFPLIAKPVDDGCSSAVKKIKSFSELTAFAEAIFRKTEYLPEKEAAILNLKPKEEFPHKTLFLIEELIDSDGAEHFLEITGGMLTNLDDNGEIEFEIFEASEALSGGDVLSLEEKFLAGEGQNITPARYASDAKERQRISEIVKDEFMRAAKLLDVEGYARIDAFVRIFDDGRVETIFIEVNSLPGMTPATCIFHQTALAGYKPYDFIDHILKYGMQKMKRPVKLQY
jgi:UDP-N-acetylmuramate--alanine ligase